MSPSKYFLSQSEPTEKVSKPDQFKHWHFNFCTETEWVIQMSIRNISIVDLLNSDEIKIYFPSDFLQKYISLFLNEFNWKFWEKFSEPRGINNQSETSEKIVFSSESLSKLGLDSSPISSIIQSFYTLLSNPIL